ncbi:hypothetical protein HNQ07_004328 [Deinococcus metalli]|uniref:DUF2330 domain-containing protein n=1 Tax=Deinococcus metalli TaxID=1141878 RepID=A0A7W8KIH8_9DEIO|nr:hypothetical protein [Deinococcus metalli]MBB5378821.1 hypothetical protein [Deinococcus metalli]GHF60522.1 hypothetical protein GCM10017781_40900 [Deinococcus metalli]
MRPLALALSLLVSSSLAGGAEPPLLGTPFCLASGCRLVATLTPGDEEQVLIYGLKGSPAAELRVWREGGRVTVARYVLRDTQGTAREKRAVMAAFFGAAFGAPFTAPDVDTLYRLIRADLVTVPVGGQRFILHSGFDAVSPDGQRWDWAVTATVDLPAAVRLRNDPWGKKPVLSFVWDNQPASRAALLTLTPAEQRRFDDLVGADRAQVFTGPFSASSPAAEVARDPAVRAYLAEQDRQMRALLGDRYAAFREWIRAFYTWPL